MNIPACCVRALSTASLLMVSPVLVSCGEDEPSAAICSSVDSLESAVDEMRSIEVDRGALAALQQSFERVQADLASVVSDAEEEYGAEIDGVQRSSSDLKSSLDAAIAAPSVGTLSAVRVGAQGLGASLTSLTEAVEGTC